MIKKIKEPSEQISKCFYLSCLKTFSYEKEDVQKESDSVSYVICPHCGEKTYIISFEITKEDYIK